MKNNNQQPLNIFLSHCSKDAEPLNKFKNMFKKSNKMFYSSQTETGIDGGASLCNAIDEGLKTCNIFICIITENYIRSIYCLYELFVAANIAASNKNFKIIPIVTKDSTLNKIKHILNRLDLVYIMCDSKSPEKSIAKSFKNYLKKPNLNSIKKVTDGLLKTEKKAGAYVGGKWEYDNILKYCYAADVKRIATTHADNVRMRDRITNADEIIIVSTTGDALVRNIKQAITDAVKNGADFKMCMPNRYSEYTLDVSNIEGRKDEQMRKSNAQRIAQEFRNTSIYLKEAYKIAKQRAKKGQKLGTITLYCTYTLLRQTVIMARKGTSYWIWCTLTMPAVRVVGGVPSIEYEGDINNSRTINCIKLYSDYMIEVAKKRGGVIHIDDKSQPKPFKLEKFESKHEWNHKLLEAEKHMKILENENSKILIEVTSEKNLKECKSLDKEFISKLDLAVYLFNKHSKNKVPTFICPICLNNNALTQKAYKYLIDNNIPENRIIVNNLNVEKINDLEDIYHWLSNLFDSQKFNKLICVCSPNETCRRTLNAIRYGIIPECYSVPSTYSYQSVLDEVFDNLNNEIERLEPKIKIRKK